MVDKLINIKTDLDDGDPRFSDQLNANFTEIKQKVGLTYQSVDFMIDAENDWTLAAVGSQVPSVDNPTQTMAEVCAGEISHRCFKFIEIQPPNVTFTDLIPAVVIEDMSVDNIRMRKEIAKCGVDLVAHTNLEHLLDGNPGMKRIYLMFQAVSSKPSMDLRYKILLY